MVQMDPVPDTTIRDILDRRAGETPDFVYVRFQDRAWSIAEVNDQANRIANALLARGLQPGDRVALMLPSHPDHIIAILALAKVGLVRVPVNVSLKGAALDHVFEAFEPHLLIADAEYEEVLQPILAERGFSAVAWRNGGPAAALAWDALVAHADNASPSVAPEVDDIVALTPSSGTTGAPKGVLKSDRTMRAGPMAILKLTGVQPGGTFLLWEALHHGAGVAVTLAALIQGVTLAMVDRFSASRFWSEAKRCGATHIHYLGSVLPMLLKQPPSQEDRSHGVGIAWGGGCPANIWDAIEQRFGVEIREGYGLSELVTFVTGNIGGPSGSIGKPLSWYEVRLTDDGGEEVPIGETGEMCFRATAPGLGFLGYFRNEQASRESMRGEWFRTGDLARTDAEGNLYYAGRKKETIRRRGINISAWEVERVLNEHEAIGECALIPVPSDIGEDELKIVIRLAPGATLDPAALIAWSEERLPYFQVPRFVAFVEEFPKTPTQRIRKAELPRTIADAWDREASDRITRNKAGA